MDTRTLSLTLTLLGVLTQVGTAQNNDIPTRVAAILKRSCYECHGDKKTAGKLNVLDMKSLEGRKAVVFGKLDESELYARIVSKDEADIMPPPNKGAKLNETEVAILRDWIKGQTVATAQPEPQPAPDPEYQVPLGVVYVMNAVMQDVRRIPIEHRPYIRYMSLTHLLGPKISKTELQLHRDALTKAINHLSWSAKLVQPQSVDSTRTIFRIDLRDLGWDRPLYNKRYHNGSYEYVKSKHNIFDLALLEYPYGVLYGNPVYQSLCKEYLVYTHQVRPVPFVRADWFVSTVTQPPLYHDFLQLPNTIDELEEILKVDAKNNLLSGRAVRGGVINSGVSRNNRVNERHVARYGYYWKSFDFKTSQAEENIFTDPVNLNQAGGEMIFSLPNGLQGYYVCNDKGVRVDFAPTNIVIDKFATDSTVRNGLACMRCHNVGMKEFQDVVRKIVTDLGGRATFDRKLTLDIYREQSIIDRLLKQDGEKFVNTMTQLLGSDQKEEPLRRVSQRFLDDRLDVREAAFELGMTNPDKLMELFKRPELIDIGLAPLAANQPLARDAWELYYDRIVRLLTFGSAVPAIDGLTRPEYQITNHHSFNFTLRTNKVGNVFGKKDDMIIFVKPTKDVYIEVIRSGAKGGKEILASSSTFVKAGTEYRYPPEGKKMKPLEGDGTESITVFASPNKFVGGEIYTGKYMADRVIHGYQIVKNGNNLQVQVSIDPRYTIKKTISLEVK